MKRILILFSALLFSIPALCQDKNIDSLIHVLETKNISPEEKLKAYDDLSYFYASSDFEKALEYASKGMQLARRIKNKKMQSVFYRNMGIVYFIKASYDTAHVNNQKALALALDIGDKQLESKIYVGFGNVFFREYNYEAAIEYYLKALEVDESGPNKTTAAILTNLGVIHRTLKNPGRAIPYFEQALDIAEQLHLNDMKATIYNGLGTSYLGKHEFDKAIGYMETALAMSREAGNKLVEMATLMTLASQFREMGEYDKALRYTQDALVIGEKMGSIHEMCNIWSVMAWIYLGMENYKECEAVALKVWQVDSTSYELAAPTAETLSHAYIHLDEKEKAEYFLRKYYEITVSGNEKSLHDSLVNMEVKYETEKKELRISSLEKERKLYIWLAISGILLLFVTSIILVQKIKSEQRKRQLVAANALQEGEIGERERLASELHDRLGGTLSAAKSEINNTRDITVINKKLDECIEEVRRITHNMMPYSLHLGLRAALEDFAAQFPNVHFYFSGVEVAIGKRLEFVIYCCANELITNSIRHSKADSIHLQLIEEQNRISLTVQDDGCGFDKETVERGIGLNNIYNRVASCNGKIEIASQIGRGTETTIEFKIKNA